MPQVSARSNDEVGRGYVAGIAVGEEFLFVERFGIDAFGKGTFRRADDFVLSSVSHGQNEQEIFVRSRFEFYRVEGFHDVLG